MKNLIDSLDKAFESRVRLGIMAVLVVNERVDFGTLKELLNLTDGNLASHLKPLEAAGYVDLQKQFVGRKPNTSYAATPAGRTAFQNHLNTLEELIKQQK
ncbi:MAG: transcriptional regulator [Bernardetiaceae bacterium]|nr:transcriptional regulator [Bernardetiaceae bacterium]